MKNYLGIYMGHAEAVTQRPDDATIARGMAAWHKWMSDNAASVVFAGGPWARPRRLARTASPTSATAWPDLSW